MGVALATTFGVIVVAYRRKDTGEGEALQSFGRAGFPHGANAAGGPPDATPNLRRPSRSLRAATAEEKERAKDLIRQYLEAGGTGSEGIQRLLAQMAAEAPWGLAAVAADPSLDTKLRAVAVGFLSNCAEDWAAAVLLPFLGSDYPQALRTEAMRGIGRLRVAEALPALKNLLLTEQQDGSLALAAIKCIGEIGGPVAQADLIELLRDPTWNALYLEIASSLALHGDVVAGTELMKRWLELADASSLDPKACQLQLLMALGGFDPTVHAQSVRQMLRALPGQDVDTINRKNRLISTLMQNQAAEAADLLREVALDATAHPGNRKQAVIALGNVERPGSCDALLEIIDSSRDRKVGYQAARALSRLQYVDMDRLRELNLRALVDRNAELAIATAARIAADDALLARDPEIAEQLRRCKQAFSESRLPELQQLRARLAAQDPDPIATLQSVYEQPAGRMFVLESSFLRDGADPRAAAFLGQLVRDVTLDSDRRTEAATRVASAGRIGELQDVLMDAAAHDQDLKFAASCADLIRSRGDAAARDALDRLILQCKDVLRQKMLGGDERSRQ